MKKKLHNISIKGLPFIYIFLFYNLHGFCQYSQKTDSLEYWRQMGYEARIQDENVKALKYYKKILTIQPNDWDANLAAARLYFNMENYSSAYELYHNIYENDSTDVEALWGIGRCFFRKGQFEKASEWLETAVAFLPNYVPLLFDLAYAYRNNDQLDKALNVFEGIIKIDSANAHAWAGAGQLYYWKGMPYTAKKFYQKALEFEKDNPEFIDVFKRVKQEMSWSINYQFLYINESEPVELGSDQKAYNIDAFVQRLTINKRINDYIFLSAGTYIDRSTREYVWQENEKRWYDSSMLRVMFIRNNNRLSLYGSISTIENLFTAYGLSYAYSRRINNIRLTNNFSSGYEYYYYWNEVGHDFFMNNLSLSYKGFAVDAVYRYASVRPLYVFESDAEERNPGHLYGITGKYTFLKNPKLSIGMYHQYRDYKYNSPMYWSPQKRKLNGLLAQINWRISDNFYTVVYGNIGKDNYDVEHWEASAEIGYNYKNTSVSTGVYRFYNSWYQSFNTNLTIVQRF